MIPDKTLADSINWHNLQMLCAGKKYSGEIQSKAGRMMNGFFQRLKDEASVQTSVQTSDEASVQTSAGMQQDRNDLMNALESGGLPIMSVHQAERIRILQKELLQELTLSHEIPDEILLKVSGQLLEVCKDHALSPRILMNAVKARFNRKTDLKLKGAASTLPGHSDCGVDNDLLEQLAEYLIDGCRKERFVPSTFITELHFTVLSQTSSPVSSLTRPQRRKANKPTR